MRVLVVDDEADVRMVVGAALSAADVELFDAADGTTALEILATTTIDVVVLDVMLPPRSGFDVLTRIRRDPALAAIAVVMLTAKRGERDHLTAFRVGADAYLTKPFTIDDLEVTVRSVVALSPAERVTRREAELSRAELLAQIESTFA